MTLDEAYWLVNNLDVRDPIRRFAPQWAIVVVNPAGEVVHIEQHKELPQPEFARSVLEKYPSCVQFVACPGDYPSIEDFRTKLKSCVWAAENY